MADAVLAQLEELYRGEYRRFVRVAAGVLRDEERAVDAVQEAFAAAVQKRGKFRGEGPLEAWVWRLVVNAALKERARARPIALAEPPVPAPAENPTPIGEAIARLPERGYDAHGLVVQRAAVLFKLPSS